MQQRQNRNMEKQSYYHPDWNKNIEKMITRKTRENNEGLLDRLFSEKTKTLKASVGALLEEIKLRENLNKNLVNKIDEVIFDRKKNIKCLEKMNNNYLFESFVQLSKMKNHIQSHVIELEKEKRKEQLECWRDLMFLKKYLMVALREYWNMVNRRSFLED